jgi:hypothetical protein
LAVITIRPAPELLPCMSRAYVGDVPYKVSDNRLMLLRPFRHFQSCRRMTWNFLTYRPLWFQCPRRLSKTPTLKLRCTTTIVWIAPGGFDESAAFVNNDAFMKIEEPIEHPVFNPGSPKEEFAFLDMFLGDVKPASGDVDLWVGNEDFMNAVLGDDQSLSTFPGLQLNEDLFIAANKESAVDIFPVNPQRSMLMW